MRIFILVVSLILVLTACNGNPESTIAFAEIPETGDPVNGEAIFGEYRCSACHYEDASGAPSLVNFADYAGDVVDGQSAREYTFYSIVQPGEYIAEGYGNAMPNNYDEQMTPQEIADLIAYLLDG